MTLQELRRVMNEDPREMPSEVLVWAMEVVGERMQVMPEDAPARRRYEDRLATLQMVLDRRVR